MPLGKADSHHYRAAAATIALLMAGVAMPTPLYNLYSREFGLSAGDVSLVFAVYAASLIPSLTLLGGMSDVVGRRRTILSGLALLAVGSLVFAFAGGPLWLIIARLFQGFATGIGLGAAVAAVTDWLPEEERNSAGQVCVVATAAGASFGALLGGSFGQYLPHGAMTAFLVHVGLLVAVALSIALIPSHPHVHPLHSSVVLVPQAILRPFSLAASQAFIGWGTLGVFMSLVPTFLEASLHLSNLMVGAAVLAAIQLSVVPATLAGARLGNRFAIIFGMLVLGVGVWSLLLSSTLHLIALIAVSAICVGVGFGLSYLVGLRIIEGVAPPGERANVTSAFLLACYLGLTLPTLTIGFAADSIGLVKAMFAAALVLGSIAVAIMAFARDRYLRRDETPANSTISEI